VEIATFLGAPTTRADAAAGRWPNSAGPGGSSLAATATGSVMVIAHPGSANAGWVVGV
jgi:hypothetical protein